jgi:hypothetical protein
VTYKSKPPLEGTSRTIEQAAIVADNDPPLWQKRTSRIIEQAIIIATVTDNEPYH